MKAQDISVKAQSHTKLKNCDFSVTSATDIDVTNLIELLKKKLTEEKARGCEIQPFLHKDN